MSKPRPGHAAPDLSLPLVGGGEWNLADRQPENFSVIVFYRGLHCPICKSNLRDLQRRLDEFNSRGVDVLVASCDSAERAKQSVEDWGIGDLHVGYELGIDAARSWGLFISSAISDVEPARFCEPGLFMVRPDHTIYAASIQSMPFARPGYGDLLGAIDFILDKGYPPRGVEG